MADTLQSRKQPAAQPPESGPAPPHALNLDRYPLEVLEAVLQFLRNRKKDEGLRTPQSSRPA